MSESPKNRPLASTVLKNEHLIVCEARLKKHRILWGKDRSIPFDENVGEKYPVPEDILKLIEGNEFDFKKIDKIDPRYYRELARALIGRSIPMAVYVIRGMNSFIGIAPLEIALMLHEKGYDLLILRFEAIFGSRVWSKLGIRRPLEFV